MNQFAKAQPVAILITEALEDYFEGAGRYPEKLGELTFEDSPTFSAMGGTVEDLEAFDYVSDGASFKFIWENE